MPVTIQNIADRVGVSKQAVSYALNGKHGQVSEATRLNVLETARTLGYRPNWRARSFARQESGTIGLVYGRPADYVEHSAMVSALVQHLAALGRELMLIPAMGPVAEWGHKLHDGRVDGVLITHPMPLELDAFVAERRLPAVFLNLRSEQDVPQVSFDDAAGTRLAVEHLLGLGHRRIAYFCSPKSHGEHYSNAEREKAYGAAMAAAGLAAEASVVVDGYEAFVRRLAAGGPRKRPTALVVYNDYDALRLLQWLWRVGLRVPQDLSLVGFNDEPAAGDAVPPLTTVAAPVAEMARHAVTHLLETAASSSETPRAVLPLSLCVRESTAPPPAAAS